MPTYYSVDRRNTYKEGEELGLSIPDDLEYIITPFPDFFESNEVANFFKESFQGGLSRHGLDYLFSMRPYIPQAGEPPDAYWHHETAVELLFEYFRSTNFPTMPSRFKCYFSWETLTEAIAFKQEGQNVYELFSEEAYKMDWKWLSLGVQGIAGPYMASQYWKGVPSGKPVWEVLLPAPVKVGKVVA